MLPINKSKGGQNPPYTGESRPKSPGGSMTQKWHGEAEKCDLCKAKFVKVFFDARTIHGPWGLLCESCHEVHGVGLGIGKGQKYDAETKIKLEG